MLYALAGALLLSVLGVAFVLVRRASARSSGEAPTAPVEGAPAEEAAPPGNRVVLRFGTRVSRLDERGQEQESEIREPSVLLCFDGMKLLDHDDDPGSDPAFDTYPEIIAASLQLVFAEGELQAELALDLADEPRATHLERYRSELPGDYWERAWAHDLEWDEPEPRPPCFRETDLLNVAVASQLLELRVS